MMDEHLKQTYMKAVYREEAFLINEKPFTLRLGDLSHLYLLPHIATAIID